MVKTIKKLNFKECTADTIVFKFLINSNQLHQHIIVSLEYLFFLGVDIVIWNITLSMHIS